MSKAVPQCPVTAASTALERQRPWGVCGEVVHVLVISLADGAGHMHKAALGQSHAPCPHAEGERDALHQQCCQPHTKACGHGAVEAAQGICVTQLFSGPACCHLLPLIASESFQIYLETWAAFSPMGAELTVDLTASSKEDTARGFGEFDSLQKARVYW